MFKEGLGVKKVVVKCGRTDLRRGIDGLVATIRLSFGLDPLEEGTLFLFCGTRKDRIKGLLYEGLSADFCYPHIFKLNPSNRRFSEKFPVETMRIKI